MSTTKVFYDWGTERGTARSRRVDLLKEKQRAVIEASLRRHEAVVAASLELTQLYDLEQRKIAFLTPGGRYDRSLEALLPEDLASIPLPAVSAKRGRGRPPKYGPGNPRPPRVRNRKRSTSVKSVSPVTASPARSVAPQVATAVGRALLVDTIAAKQDVTASVDMVVTFSDEAIVASAPAASEAPAFDRHAAAERLNGYRLAALREFAAGAEMTIDGEIILAAYLQSHRRELHECAPDWVRGQDGAKRHDYDFTDAADAEKVRPEIRTLFKGFGLSRHEPTFDRKDPSRGMCEEDLQLWMKAHFFNDVDYPASDYDVYIERYGSARDYYRFDRTGMERGINEERERFWVWPIIERRLASVERRADQVERGEIDLTTAKVRVMDDEICFIGGLTWTEQAIYRKIVDAMTWFDGFSRLELLAWAGDDPTLDRKCRIHQRFPAWAFPKELHQDVLDGWIFEDAARFDYAAPTPDDLVAFAEKDEQGRIENLHNLSKLDFADIEL